MIDNVRWKNTKDLARYMAVFGDGNEVKNINYKSADLKEKIENIDCENSISKENSICDEKIIGSCDVNHIREDIEKLSVKEQMSEFMFLGLRMQKGVAKEEFMEAFGVDFDHQYGEITQKFIDEGFMEVKEFEYYNPETKSDYVKTRVSLTDKGIDVSNTIMAEYLLD